MKQGIKLLVMDTQCSNIHYSDEIFSRDKRLHYEAINEKEAIIISCKDSRRFLKDMGISGEIISTTSHSEDSLSLVLDNGVYWLWRFMIDKNVQGKVMVRWR